MVQQLHPVEVVVAPQPIVQAIIVEPEPVVVTESRRITLDVPLDLYKQMKRRVFDDGITLKKYILELVREDLTK